MRTTIRLAALLLALGAAASPAFSQQGSTWARERDYRDLEKAFADLATKALVVDPNDKEIPVLMGEIALEQMDLLRVRAAELETSGQGESFEGRLTKARLGSVTQRLVLVARLMHDGAAPIFWPMPLTDPPAPVPADAPQRHA